MKIDYEITKPDMASGAWAVMRNSPSALTQTVLAVILCALLTAGVLVAAMSVVYGYRGAPWPDAYPYVMAFFCVLLPFYFLRAMGKHFETAMDRPGMAGGHTITLSEKGLLEETSVNSTLHAWQGVEDIVVTRLFLLIEVSSQRFHVIPRRAFASVADCDAFVSEVRRYIQASQSPAVA